MIGWRRANVANETERNETKRNENGNGNGNGNKNGIGNKNGFGNVNVSLLFVSDDVIDE